MFPKILLPFALIAASIASACTITPNSIAGIQLGQTLAQVQRALPQAQIRSEADAETGEITLITLPQPPTASAPAWHCAMPKKRWAKCAILN